MKKRTLLILLSLFIISCDEPNPTKSIVNPIIGVWEWTETILTTGSITQTTQSDYYHMITYVFGEDGTFSYQISTEGVVESNSGTWSTTDNKLTMAVDVDTIISDFSINYNILSISDIIEEEDVTYYRELKFIKQ